MWCGEFGFHLVRKCPPDWTRPGVNVCIIDVTLTRIPHSLDALVIITLMYLPCKKVLILVLGYMNVQTWTGAVANGQGSVTSY